MNTPPHWDKSGMLPGQDAYVCRPDPSIGKLLWVRNVNGVYEYLHGRSFLVYKGEWQLLDGVNSMDEAKAVALVITRMST